MKKLLLCLAILSSISALGQAKECDFPKFWKVDHSNVMATQVVKDENGDRFADTLDINLFEGKYELPDSVVFNEGKVSLFFTNDEKVRIVEGIYKLSEKKFSFKAKGTPMALVKYKFKRDQASCSLVKDGINMTTFIKRDDELVWIRFYLIPLS